MPEGDLTATNIPLPSRATEVLERSSVRSPHGLPVEETEAEIIVTASVSSGHLKQLAREALIPLLRLRKLLNRVEVNRL
jgi:hypothetical protein